MTTAHLDPGVLAALREIMGDDFPLLVGTYLRDSERRLARLLTVAEGQALSEAAHSFKGSSSNMGALRLAELCGRLEHLAPGADPQTATALRQQIVEEFTAVRTAFLALA